MHPGGDRSPDKNGDHSQRGTRRPVRIPVVSRVDGRQVAGVCVCRKDAEGRILICERFKKRAIDLVKGHQRKRRSFIVAAASAMAGMAVGIVLDPALEVLAIMAAVGAALAYAFNS